MKPAIFNTEMVRAILDGRKTNTRRPFSKYIEKVIKYAQLLGEIGSNGVDRPFSNGDIKYLLEFAPYKVGDIIYVRETWSNTDPKNGEEIEPIYKADAPFEYGHIDNRHWFFSEEVKWKPSIHMPKEYARLFLRVKDVRIERLNEISADDACKEGLDWKDYWCDNGQSINDPREWFKTLWESIYGNGSFDNRYVWVIEFERIGK